MRMSKTRWIRIEVKTEQRLKGLEEEDEEEVEKKMSRKKNRKEKQVTRKI